MIKSSYKSLIILGVAFSITLGYSKELQHDSQYTAHIVFTPLATHDSDLTINLNSKHDIKKWGLGFFMFHVFVNPKLNQSLHAKICVAGSSQCANLQILEKPLGHTLKTFIAPQLSYGHITIFSPTTPFALKRGLNYSVHIHDSISTPQNITAMPQKLFIYNLDLKQTATINVLSYVVHGLSANLLASKAKNTILANWNSCATDKSHIVSRVVPVPKHVQFDNSGGNYVLTSNVVIGKHNNDEFVAQLIKSRLSENDNKSEKSSKVNLDLCSSQIDGCKPIALHPEGYILAITQNGVDILANNAAGFFYAAQTLLQLNSYYSGSIPSQTITDYPRFKYRGIMLDTVRHFFSVVEIKKLLDVMAAHKLNTLHLHLADDEGWRVYLPKYPQLTNLGSKRALGLPIGPSNLVDGKYDITNYKGKKYVSASNLYQGFYTLSQLSDIIHYANLRQITIIPEIELPGHSGALKKSLPEIFFSVNEPLDSYSVQGYNDNILPICKYGLDGKFTSTLDDIISQVANIFNQQKTLYAKSMEISLAGDEVPLGSLSGNPECSRAQWHGLNDEQITNLFFRQVARNLPQIQLSGWQQIVQSDNGDINAAITLPVDRAAHIWEWMPTTNIPVSGYTMADNLLEKGYPTILDFADLSYFDMRYTNQFSEPGLYWSADSAGTYAALSNGWLINNLKHASQVLGLEGALWSELLPTSEHMFYMALPKMAGLAEASWSSPTILNWCDLAPRLGDGKTGFLNYLSNTYNIRYRGFPNGIKLEVPTGAILAKPKQQ